MRKALILPVFIISFAVLHSQSSYHDSTGCCTIIEEPGCPLPRYLQDKINIYKAFTGYDTIMLISKKTDVLDLNGLIKIQKGNKYKLKLKFIPWCLDLADSSMIPYERSIDSLAYIMLITTDWGVKFVTHKEIYYEMDYVRDYVRKWATAENPFFLFYTSYEIIDKYVPDSLLVR